MPWNAFRWNEMENSVLMERRRAVFAWNEFFIQNIRRYNWRIAQETEEIFKGGKRGLGITVNQHVEL